MDVVLGIDIGGTKTSFGFVDRQGALMMATSIPTKADNSVDKFLSRLHQEVEKARSGLSPHNLLGIGIGAPNSNYYRGTIENPVNLNWGEIIYFVDLMKNYYDLPVFITNDAKTAALGEMLFGNARGMQHFLVITIGTGLGSGIVAHGRLIYGYSGFAGEIGHTVVDPQGRSCKCGKKGCLETYVSGPGLVRTFRELLEKHQGNNPITTKNFDGITAEDVSRFAKEGNPVALEAFDKTAGCLAIKLADAVAHTSPEAIFLTGGVTKAGDFLLQPIKQHIEDFLFTPYKDKVRLMLSGLEPGTSAILGAAALTWNELESRIIND